MGVQVDLDGVYNRRRWDEEPEVWSYNGPFADWQERLIHQALSVQFMTGQEIAEDVRPPLPQIELFRPRYGYPDIQDRQLTVDQVVTVDRMLPARASWYSGGAAGYTGSPRYMSNNLGML